MATDEAKQAKVNGALIGAGSSAIGGAALGAMITGPAAPVGAIVGGIIGAIFGAVAGAGVGGAVYNRAEANRELDLAATTIEQQEETSRLETYAPYIGGSLLVIVIAVAWFLVRGDK